MSKAERQLQDRLNRVANVFPGKRRLWELARIGEELRIEADVRDEQDRPTDEIDALLADALLIHRLAWDLMEIRDVLRGGQRGTDVALSKYDPANWRGPRP